MVLSNGLVYLSVVTFSFNDALMSKKHAASNDS